MNFIDDSIIFPSQEYAFSQQYSSISHNYVSVINSWMKPKSSLSPPDKHVSEAINMLAQSPPEERNASFKYLIDEYIEDMRSHFMEYAAPLLKSALCGIEYSSQSHSPSRTPDATNVSKIEPQELVPRIVSIISTSKSHYLHPLSSLPKLPESLYTCVSDAYTALAAITLSSSQLSKLVKIYLSNTVLANANQETILVLRTLQEVTGIVVNSKGSRLSSSHGTGKLLQNEILRTFTLDVSLVLKQNYGKVWDREIRSEIEEWSEKVLAPTAIALFPEVSHGNLEWSQESNQDEELAIKQYLNRLTSDIMLEIRTQELFDIVVHYPKSLPAVNDMKSFLHSPTQRAAIVTSMQHSCSRRLLHGGANTVDVLALYVSLIRVFAKLEPRGVLLHKIARPIRRYLKERNDTIREVLSGLLGDKRSPIKDLASELVNAAKIEDSHTGTLENTVSVNEASHEKMKEMTTSYKTLLKDPDMDWIPDPMDAPPDFQTDNKTFDVISNLVSVFDNKDVLVKELMIRFADTMVFSHEFDEETMLMTIELLKLKFGESALSSLDVMIKDMTDSKRIDNLVHVKSGNPSNTNEDVDMDEAASVKNIDKKVEEVFHVDVISKLFWPKYNVMECRPPKVIQDQMSNYSSYFEQLKQGRSLEWMGNIGRVTIEVEMDETIVVEGKSQKKIMEYVVSPEKASVVYLFQEKEEWMLSSLSTELEMTLQNARTALQFWCKRGVLYLKNESKDLGAEVYSVQKEQPDKKHNVYDSLGSSSSARDDGTEEMRIYWSYIVGMLTNLGAVPLAKMHSFLKMLVPADTPYTKSMEELKAFLDMMVEEEKIVIVGESYKLLK